MTPELLLPFANPVFMRVSALTLPPRRRRPQPRPALTLTIVRQLATAHRLAGHERPATRYGTKPRRRYGSATALLPGGNKCTKSRGTGAVSGLESLALARRRVFTGSVSGQGGRFFQSPGLPNLDARAGDVLEAARAVRAVIELAG
jgi:hypothetical protein